MSCICAFFSRCCGGREPADEDDHTVPMRTASSLNMVVTEADPSDPRFGAGRHTNGGANSSGCGAGVSGSFESGSTSYNPHGGSDAYSNNGSVCVTTGKPRRRGVSFAPDGFCPPPSPEMKTSEVLSPRTRAKSIIKASSFSGAPIHADAYSNNNSYVSNGSYAAGGGGQGGGKTLSSRSTPYHTYASGSASANMSLSADQGLSSAILRDDLL